MGVNPSLVLFSNFPHPDIVLSVHFFSPGMDLFAPQLLQRAAELLTELIVSKVKHLGPIIVLLLLHDSASGKNEGLEIEEHDFREEVLNDQVLVAEVSCEEFEFCL